MQDRKLLLSEIRRHLLEARYKAESMLIELEEDDSEDACDARLDTVVFICDTETLLTTLNAIKS